jgi:asparaginyl-tRNA synthetase
MSLPLRRGRVFRLASRLPPAGYGSCRCPQSPWSRRVHSSTTSPSTIAALLRQTQSSSSSSQSVPSGDTLTINGFVRSVRKQKRVAFAAIGDGSSLQTVQAVLTPEQAEESVPTHRVLHRLIWSRRLSTGTAVAIAGQWTPSRGAGQSYELQAHSVRILGQNDPTVSAARLCTICISRLIFIS